jgi:hypothetical protein
VPLFSSFFLGIATTAMAWFRALLERSEVAELRRYYGRERPHADRQRVLS